MLIQRTTQPCLLSSASQPRIPFPYVLNQCAKNYISMLFNHLLLGLPSEGLRTRFPTTILHTQTRLLRFTNHQRCSQRDTLNRSRISIMLLRSQYYPHRLTAHILFSKQLTAFHTYTEHMEKTNVFLTPKCLAFNVLESMKYVNSFRTEQ